MHLCILVCRLISFAETMYRGKHDISDNLCKQILLTEKNGWHRNIYYNLANTTQQGSALLQNHIRFRFVL